MYWAPDLTDYLTSATLQVLIPTTCLIATPKTSPLRYAAIASMIALTYRFIHPHEGASTTRITATVQLITTTVQAIHLLLLNALDNTDLARELPYYPVFLSDRIYYAAKQVTQLRAIGTPRQIKHVPAHPAYYARRAAKSGKADADSIPRGQFLIRQIVIFIWQYLALDLLQALAREKAFQQAGSKGFTHVNWFVSAEQWVERGLTNLFTWFVILRIMIDSNYRIVSILFVAMGLDSPASWPPAFGRMADVYTIRKFWGKFWHQFLRQPFTAVSNFIVRDVLHLPRPSILERYTNIFTVFLLSGILHALTDRVQTIPCEYSGALIGFPITAFGIMLEDGVQALWNRLRSPAGKQAPVSDENLVPSLWQRVVGYVWTMTWLGVVSTWYLYPFYELPQDLVTLVPVSLSEKYGMQFLGTIVLGAGLLVGFIFGAEI